MNPFAVVRLRSLLLALVILREMIIEETVVMILFLLLFYEILLQSFYVPRILLLFSHAVLHDARGVFIIVTFNFIVIISISDGHFTS